MEPKPKERIVFDEDLYYGDEGKEAATALANGDAL